MSWLRDHKLLVTIYCATLTVAFFELTDPSVSGDRQDSPATFLQPDRNIADVSLALYPDRASTLFYRANQAALCSDPDAARLPTCQARGPVEPGEVRELLARSIATGNRSNELAMYNYAWVLLQEGAPDEEVDAAVETWRDAYPASARPDPREAYSQTMRGR